MPLDTIEVLDGELEMVIGGIASSSEAVGLGCNCECEKGSEPGDLGAGCNCTCNITTAAPVE